MKYRCYRAAREGRFWGRWLGLSDGAFALTKLKLASTIDDVEREPDAAARGRRSRVQIGGQGAVRYFASECSSEPGQIISINAPLWRLRPACGRAVACRRRCKIRLLARTRPPIYTGHCETGPAPYPIFAPTRVLRGPETIETELAASGV